MLYGLERQSAIQQRGIVPFCKGIDVIQQAQSGIGKTATFCTGILQRLDYQTVECQALVLAPTREPAQQIQKVMLALGGYLFVKFMLVSVAPSFARINESSPLVFMLLLALLVMSSTCSKESHFTLPTLRCLC